MEKVLNLRSLAPANDKPDETYKQALDEALSKNSIRNIALTGPYGSGKSTVLLSYEKNRIESSRKGIFRKGEKPFLKISLASFVTESYEPAYADSDTIHQPRSIPDDKQEEILRKVERGILEQMIYSLPANKLPQSRFRRITSPRLTWLKASIALIWLSLIGFGYISPEQALPILKEAIVNNPPTLSFLAFIIFAIPPTYLIAKIYEATFGLTLGKLSLKNLEIEATNRRNHSILNQHIDEILYFFEITKYQVVVFEDLDRFGSSEIFFKLKELNKVINDHLGMGQPVKFIYALRDAMIKGEDRTKFFDLIIPVVPVINPNNSLDIFHRELDALRLKDPIDKKLIAGASVFIVDPRLIANILNEFEIYASIIAETDLTLSRLLAIIIYKNTYPEDFEKLHHKDGVFFKLTSAKKDFINNARKQAEQKIKEINSKRDGIEKKQQLGEQRLVEMYIGHFIRSIAPNQNAGGIKVGGGNAPFASLTLDQLIQAKSNNEISLYASNNTNLILVTLDFSEVESELHPGHTIEDMAEQLRANVNGLDQSLANDAADLAEEIDQLPFKSLSQLYHDGFVEGDLLDLTELAKQLGHQPALFEFLVKGGHIDETYPVYISLFHEGRLTRDDYNFVCGVINGTEGDSEATVNKPEEICDTFEPKDFESPYFWNIHIMDFLVKHKGYRSHRDYALKYLSNHMEQAGHFLKTYLTSGKHRDEFLRVWGEKDTRIASKAIGNEDFGTLLVQRLLHAFSGSHMSKLLPLNQSGDLSDYLSKHGEQVFTPDYELPENLQAINQLGIKFVDLESIRHATLVTEYACQNSLYQVNVKNITFHLKHMLDGRSGESNIYNSNYTMIINSGDERLQAHVSENINTYVREVLLQLPDNTRESSDAILQLLNHESLDAELKQKFISKQEHVFDSFYSIPKEFWSLLIEQHKITPSIENFLNLFDERSDDKEVIELLNANPAWVTSLSTGYQADVFAEGKQLEFDRWIVNCDELHDSVYRQLVQTIKTRFKNFPSSTSDTKDLILAEAGRVGLNEESFTQREGIPEIRAALIATNRASYFEDASKYPINDDDRAALLSSDLSSPDKQLVIEGAEFDPSAPHAKLNAGLAQLLLEGDVVPDGVQPGLLAHAIAQSEDADDALALLFKCQDKLNGNQVVWSMMRMPPPYDDLIRRWGSPTLSNSPGNLQLVELLKNRRLISSYSITGSKIKLRNYRKNRPNFNFQGQL